LITNNWTSRIIERGVDPFGLGRWSYITLIGKGNIKVMIITAYRVSQEYLSSIGHKTSAMQQFCTLSQHIRAAELTSNPRPRYQFIIDLQARLQELINKSYEIILCIDANESIHNQLGQFSPLQFSLGKPIVGSRHNGTLATLIRTCGLCDPLRIQHPGEPPPATYKRGKNRIVYILTTLSVMAATRRTGIFPYDSIFQCDHRACYIDLDVDRLLREVPSSIAPPQYMGLRTQDPRIVNKYIELLQKQINYHRLSDKASYIYNAAINGGWTQQMACEYKKIDKLLTEGMLHTECKVSKKCSRRYQWSPKLSKALKTLHYWQIRLQVTKGNPFNNKKMTILQHELKIESNQLNIPVINIVQQLRAAKHTLKAYQQNHISLHEEPLRNLAEARVLAQQPYLIHPQSLRTLEKRTSKEIHRIKHKEAQRTMHTRINRALHPSDWFKGLQSVDVPASITQTPYPEGPDPKTWSGPWRTITDPEEMAAHVCAANIRQYHQAHSSPFCSEPLLSFLGYCADTHGSTDLARGIVPPAHILDHLLPETKQVCQTLANFHPSRSTWR
jgi:hypothetical protein